MTTEEPSMTTMKALDWAFNLKIDPESKLMAIYLATLIGMSGTAKINLSDAAVWCGFVSSARKEVRPRRARGALQGVPDITYVEVETDCVIVNLWVEP